MLPSRLFTRPIMFSIGVSGTPVNASSHVRIRFAAPTSIFDSGPFLAGEKPIRKSAMNSAMAITAG